MIHNLMWLVTIASIVGTVLNIQKKPVCFWIWLITNTLWTVYDIWIRNYSQAGLSAIYVGLAVWGILTWKK
jgi:hypothetical protein